MNIETESFQKAVSSLFDSIEEGNRIYPDFIKIHFTSFTDISLPRKTMEEIIEKITSLYKDKKYLKIKEI